MTRIGCIVRATDRGLGIQTWEFTRALNAAPLVMDLGTSPGFPNHLDRFPGAPVVKMRGLLPQQIIRRWLRTVDVVYTAETTYGDRMAAWAKAEGVKMVVHINPEFWTDTAQPCIWWAPTSWRLPSLPPTTQVVPVPVAADRFTPVEPHDGPTRWLHVAGKQALADRNGTNALLAAIPHIRRPCTITVATQDAAEFSPPHNPRVQVRFASATANYWDLYVNHDALVMPRRYGGLCLPVQEAMAAGMAVLMSDVPPNPQTWPVATCPTARGSFEHMPCGRVQIANPVPRQLAQAMDDLGDPELRQGWQAKSRTWATGHSWDLWADRYRDLLAA